MTLCPIRSRLPTGAVSLYPAQGFHRNRSSGSVSASWNSSTRNRFSELGSLAAAQSNSLAAPIAQGVGVLGIELLDRRSVSSTEGEAHEPARSQRGDNCLQIHCSSPLIDPKPTDLFAGGQFWQRNHITSVKAGIGKRHLI